MNTFQVGLLLFERVKTSMTIRKG